MSFIELTFIALGLAMDALAVSVAEGIALKRVTRRHVVRVAVHFGGFQGLMPIVGWLAGSRLRAYVATWDHWVAFALLVGIGGKMLADAASGFETGPVSGPVGGWRLIGLSVATSIDALAVGVSLAMLEVLVWWPAVWIGLVTGILCAVGIRLGDRIGQRVERYAEACGGAILCLIGVRILIQHLAGG
ncbi:MAG: manganese efflux pump MntP family protein [Candidatus Brocadiia bacterium]